jgi:hypothetical protein
MALPSSAFWRAPTGRPISSGAVVFLFVWFAFVIAELAWVLGTQLVAFIVLLLIDHRLLQTDVISADYFRVRSIATALAVISLSVILIS